MSKCIYVSMLAAVIFQFCIAGNCAGIENSGKADEKKIYVLDMGGRIDDYKDVFLLTALQGIVNRDKPRFYLKSAVAADQYYLKYYKDKGYAIQNVASLPDAIEIFKNMGLVKGLVKYSEENYMQGCIAATISGLNDYLPVTNMIMKFNSEMMSGKDLLGNDNIVDNKLWKGMFADLRYGKDGVEVVPQTNTVKDGNTGASKVEFKKPSDPSGTFRMVSIDVSETPYMEVSVKELTGKWSLRLELGIDLEKFAWPINDEVKDGVYKVDLRNYIPASVGRIRVNTRVITGTVDTKFKLTGFRLLDKDGNPVKTEPQSRVCFNGLDVKQDLNAQFTNKDKYENSKELYDWALKEVLPLCSKDVTFNAQAGWWNTSGLDYAVSQKAFIFYAETKDGKLPHVYRYSFDLIEKVFAHLKKPALVFGWHSDEWVWVTKVTASGHRVICSGAPNFSLWNSLPADKDSLKFNNNRAFNKGGLQEKYYVSFTIASGDAPNILYDLFRGTWLGKERGSVPIIWEIQPALLEFAPAYVEYYVRNATPMDTFIASPTGAGYIYPSAASYEDREILFERSRDIMDRLGLTGISWWDAGGKPVSREISQFNKPGKNPAPKSYQIYPGDKYTPARNNWLDNSNSLIYYDKRPQADTCSNVSKEQLLQSILNIAKDNSPPFFIASNTRIPPSAYKWIADNLPKDKFEVIGEKDLEDLSREAGRFSIVPSSNGVCPNGSVELTLEARNPDNRKNESGIIKWQLPKGWNCSEMQWAFDNVPENSTLRHKIKLNAPAELVGEKASIVFEDSRVKWKRQIDLTCYKGEVNVIELDKPEKWIPKYDGKLNVNNGIMRMEDRVDLPVNAFCNIEAKAKEELKEDRINVPAEDYNAIKAKMKLSSTFTKKMEIDFDRNPVLELNIAETSGKWKVDLINEKGEKGFPITECSSSGIVTVNLSDSVKWTGKSIVEIIITPRNSIGHYVNFKNMKIYYQL